MMQVKWLYRLLRNVIIGASIGTGLAFCVFVTRQQSQGFIGCEHGRFVIRNIRVAHETFDGQINTDITGVRCKGPVVDPPDVWV